MERLCRIVCFMGRLAIRPCPPGQSTQRPRGLYRTSFSEALAAKKLFGDLKGALGFQTKEELEEIGEVEIHIQGSDLGPIFWTPSQHGALEAYFQSIPYIKGKYRTAEMEAEFDYNHKVCKVLCHANLKKFLEIPQKDRGPLRVSMPMEESTFGKAFQHCSLSDITHKVSERLRKWCVARFSNSPVSDDEVEKSMEKLKKENVDIKTNDSKGNGNIKEFIGVDGSQLDVVIKTLEDDKVPTEVISAMRRGKTMRKNSEGVCDYKLEGGLLKNLYVLQILMLRKKVGSTFEYDILVAYFELQLGKPVSIGGPGAQDGTVQDAVGLSISQMAALSDYVETRAANHWKKKALNLLEADKDDGIE